jgi:hypothetical protein
MKFKIVNVENVSIISKKLLRQNFKHRNLKINNLVLSASKYAYFSDKEIFYSLLLLVLRALKMLRFTWPGGKSGAFF